MRCRYNNWHQGLLALLLLATLALCNWLNSDLRLQHLIAGKLWSYQRETLNQSPLASLILSTPIKRWKEQGNLRLLSNGEAQMDLTLQLEEHADKVAQLHIAIQGRWLLSDGFLILKSSNYSALPLNDHAKSLLLHQAQSLKDIWLTQFNRSRPIVMLDPQHMLLSNNNDNIWVLSN